MNIEEMIKATKRLPKSTDRAIAINFLKSLSDAKVATKVEYDPERSYGGGYYTSFIWGLTPQGSEFWRRLVSLIEVKERLMAGGYEVKKIQAESIRVGCQTVTYDQIRTIYLRMQKLRRQKRTNSE